MIFKKYSSKIFSCLGKFSLTNCCKSLADFSSAVEPYALSGSMQYSVLASLVLFIFFTSLQLQVLSENMLFKIFALSPGLLSVALGGLEMSSLAKAEVCFDMIAYLETALSGHRVDITLTDYSQKRNHCNIPPQYVLTQKIVTRVLVLWALTHHMMLLVRNQLGMNSHNLLFTLRGSSYAFLNINKKEQFVELSGSFCSSFVLSTLNHIYTQICYTKQIQCT